MRKIPIEAIEQIEQEVPEIVDAVQRQSPGPIVLALEDFEGQPDLLFNSVWYALSHGRRVVIENLQ